MGKKKTRQNSNTVVNADPSESSDAAIVSKPVNKTVCPHLNKSVDFSTLRKNFRGNGHLANRECFECKKQNISTASEDIWVCLRCGCCCCGSEKRNHVMSHFVTPRSDSHCLVLKVETLTVRCHECDLEIPTECSQKLHSCVEFIKQQRDKLVVPTPKKNSSSSAGSSPNGSPVNSTVKASFVAAPAYKQFSTSGVKVKGLTNLGNTCFFNSVLQCLAQTPGLITLLHEMQEPGQIFSLSLKNGESFSGELEKGGPVSECLLELLIDMTKPDSNGNKVLVPRKLLTALRRKCPQFEGGDQHDAHELLRHLLDIVRTEDLRRYQRLILEKSGLSTKVNPVEVAEDKKKWVKDLNQKVSEEVTIRPDQIFKGKLVSQLQCQTCFHTSDCLESFLDLSLPVSSEKPVPPVVTRRKNQVLSKSEENEVDDTKGQAQPSKYQLKKERKLQRRGRNKKNNQHTEEGQGEPSITEEDKKESSDADVEDNDEVGIEDRKAEILESGYSSEKLASSRTSPTTESHGEVDDSACASPASASDLGPISRGIARLQIEEPTIQIEEKQCLLSHRPESGLGSSIVSVQESAVSVLGQSELTQSMDSSDSIKGNPSFTSRDMSTESLQEVGLPSQDGSVNSEHDDTLPVAKASTVLTEGCFVNRKSNTTDVQLPNIMLDVSQADLCMTINNSELSAAGDCDPNETSNVNNELSHIESQKDSRPSSMLGNDKWLARSSPVENSCNQILDSNLLSVSLENYKTEYLSGSPNHGEDDVTFLPVIELVEKEQSNIVETVQKESEESGYQEMGFVLVGGISDNNNCEISVSFSKKKTEIASLDKEQNEVAASCGDCKPNDALSSSNENNDEYVEVNPDFYRCRHITLAPRYQCFERECSVLSCLNHFTAIEMMAGNNKVGCEACTKKNNKGNKDKEVKSIYRVATKRLLICSPPPVLILHLKRFQVQRYSFRKLSCHVTFPVILDIAPFCSYSVQKQLRPGQTQVLYSLYGVVAHSGTLHGGHYYSYVKVRTGQGEEGEPSPGTWYYVSDSHSREVAVEIVQNCQAYVLFYERFL
ncbi:ubiquitin carboxyl-terminal hydrolase 16-like isoform X2 [Lycorma delicatula]